MVVEITVAVVMSTAVVLPTMPAMMPAVAAFPVSVPSSCYGRCGGAQCQKKDKRNRYAT
jgi:hypothetical protein